MRARHEHRLARIAPLLPPHLRVAALDVDLHELVHVPAGAVVAHADPVGEAVGAAVGSPVVDARQLDRLLGQRPHPHPPAPQVELVAPQLGQRRGAAVTAQPLQVQRVDHVRVVVAAEVEVDLPVALEGVHVVEGEERVGLEAADAPGAAVHHVEGRAAGRLPAEVLDEGLPVGDDLQRVHHERRLGEDHVALGEPEGVHVGRLRARDRGQEARGARAARRLHLVTGGRDQRDVVEHAPVTRQPVRVHGLDAPERRLGAEHPEGAQGVRDRSAPGAPPR